MFARIRKERNLYKRLYYKYINMRGSIGQKNCNFFEQMRNLETECDSNLVMDIIKEVSDDDTEDTECKNITKIKEDVIENIQKNTKRFCDETKIFAYGIYIRSASAYEYLRKVIPLPSVTTLKRRFNSEVLEEERHMERISSIKNIFLRQEKLLLNKCKDELSKIECCLAVDAFCVTNLVKGDDNKKLANKEKYAFLFLINPLDSTEKPFIIHIYFCNTGNAGCYVDMVIDYIVKISSETRFNIKYVSTDGDTHYSFRYKNQIVFQKGSDISTYENVRSIISCSSTLFVGDSLHLLKNFRSRILNNNIVINPFIKSASFNALTLNNILEIGPPLTDLSSIGRMRDSYPIQLFNFRQCSKLDINMKEIFFYLFTNSLLVEGLFNPELSPYTRAYLFKTLSIILTNIYEIMLNNKLPSNIVMKKSVNTKYITMFDISKLERMIPLAITLAEECTTYTDNIGLYRIGTHVLENKIGNIRQLCNNDDRKEKILRCTARYNVMKNNTCFLFEETRRNRINSGGCRLSEGTLDLQILNSPEELAAFVLSLCSFNEFFNYDTFNQFKADIIAFTTAAPYLPTVHHIQTSSSKITGRLIESSRYKIPDYTPVYESRHHWTAGEQNLMDMLLLSRMPESEILTKFSGIERNSVVCFIRKRQKLLCKRSISSDELKSIEEYLRMGLTFKEIAPLLTCRSEKHLLKLYTK